MTTQSRVCTYFRRGACRFGNQCWFSHDLGSAISGPSTRGEISDEDDVFRSQNPLLPIEDLINTSQHEGSKREKIKKPEQAQKSETESPRIFWSLKSSISGETKEGTPDSVLAETVKKLNEAENQIVTLRQQLCKKTEGKNFSWVEDQMEKCVDNDLQCSICYELLVKPTVLNCSHTFCHVCIETWTRVVNQCPTCRVKIKNKAYCLTLDSFIDKISEFLSDEIKSRRESLKTERNNIPETNRRRRNNRNNWNPRRNRNQSSRGPLGMNVIWTDRDRGGSEWNIAFEEALFNPIRLGDVLGRNQNERDEWDAIFSDSSLEESFYQDFCSYCEELGHEETECPIRIWAANGGQW